jgi:peptidoglycan/LPS O-acetylase OafA/YrhL
MLALYRLLPVFQLPANPLTILANVLFVFNFSSETYQSLVGAGWTLGVEMPFYLCVPLIIMFVRGPRAAAVIFAFSVVISMASRYWMTRHYGVSSPYPQMAFLPNVVVFMTGILIYHLIKVWGDRATLWRVLGYLGLAVMATLPLHLYWVPIVFGRPDTLLWMTAMGAICAWQAVAPSYLLSLKPMQWLGERSFGIYLIHPLVVFTCVRYGLYTAICHFLVPIGAWSYLACVVVTAAVVVPGAAFAYAAIEAPSQRIGRALIMRLYGPRHPPLVPQSAEASSDGAFSAAD